MSSDIIRAHAYVALRLPSGAHNVVQVQPNTTINLTKYGSFKTKDIIGRPYYLTFEILDKQEDETASKSGLRIVPTAELYAEINDEAISEADDATLDDNAGGVQYDVVGDDGRVVMRTNRQITDDSSSQVLTMGEIEKLKVSGTGSGRELVQKILESHSALEQKTAFALAKYTLRKTKKYLKRFTVLPLDVATLSQWIFEEKEAAKTMELRQEILALIGSWSNVHYCEPELSHSLGPDNADMARLVPGGRWLVADETAGLLTAYLAEKMGILYPHEFSNQNGANALPESKSDDNQEDISESIPSESEPAPTSNGNSMKLKNLRCHIPASTNTLTVVHPLSQPNLSLLKYFHFDPFNPAPTHPLTHHLKTLSWLQLLNPDADSSCVKPPAVDAAELATCKPSKRSTYYRKLRRWERIRHTVDETRQGGFDGLVIASAMKPESILHHLVPLLRGGAQVVVYSPHIEPLSHLADLYSVARKTAFLALPSSAYDLVPSEDFPVDPRLLLAPTIYTVRATHWQILPGRTHPLMTGKGGSDGFVFTATRVIPAEGKIEARGKYKKRKVDVRDGKVDAVGEVVIENDHDEEVEVEDEDGHGQ